MQKVGERKTRSDKKRTVIPVLQLDIKDAIFRLSHVTHTPIKDVCEYLVVYVIKDRETLDILSRQFKRGITLNTTHYFGDLNSPPIEKRIKTATVRVTVRFTGQDYDTISALAYALDCTPTRATSILLSMAIQNVAAVNAYVRDYLVDELSEGQLRELRQLLTYVNRYSNDNHSWLTLLSAIIGDIRPAMRSLREIVNEFIRNHKR
ncbi:MAG: hypothetical protein ABS949_19975 [Solibacillus sp.]